MFVIHERQRAALRDDRNDSATYFLGSSSEVRKRWASHGVPRIIVWRREPDAFKERKRAAID
eukprot:6177447-Pleurochrysis_carterae.AAC.7